MNDKDCWVEYQDNSGTYEVNLNRFSYLAFTKENMELISSLDDEAVGRIFKAIYRHIYNGCAPAEENLTGIEAVIAKTTLDTIKRLGVNSFKQKKQLKNQEEVIRRIDNE